MKLFFDENLSFKLTSILEKEYPGSVHAREAELLGVADNRIWNYCKKNSYIIVSKDTDFRECSFMEGYPPKVRWLDVGNAGTEAIANLLRSEHQRIKRFTKQRETSLLILSIDKNTV